MDDINKLAYALHHFAGISADDFKLSANFWSLKQYKKGEYFNNQNSVCRSMGFIISGAFRSYIIEKKTGEEKNIFLYTTNQFVVPFKSFINQIPCEYFTQTISEATIISINIEDLLTLYAISHKWEHFGRLMAQEAFNHTIERMEGFVYKSPEERYLDLIKNHPDVFQNVPLYHISSYLGIQGPSLSRIRKRISEK